MCVGGDCCGIWCDLVGCGCVWIDLDVWGSVVILVDVDVVVGCVFIYCWFYLMCVGVCV